MRSCSRLPSASTVWICSTLVVMGGLVGQPRTPEAHAPSLAQAVPPAIEGVSEVAAAGDGFSTEAEPFRGPHMSRTNRPTDGTPAALNTKIR
jgi:hypothetical protein